MATHTLLRAVQVLRLEHTALQADIRVLNTQLAAACQGGTPGLYVLGRNPMR